MLHVREAAPALGVPAAAGLATRGSRCPRAWVRQTSGLQSRASATWPPQCSPGASLSEAPPKASTPPPLAHQATRDATLLPLFDDSNSALLPLFDPALSPRNTALVACVDGGTAPRSGQGMAWAFGGVARRA